MTSCLPLSGMMNMHKANHPVTISAITRSSLGVGAQVWEGSYLCVPSPPPRRAEEMKV